MSSFFVQFIGVFDFSAAVCYFLVETILDTFLTFVFVIVFYLWVCDVLGCGTMMLLSRNLDYLEG
jgi:hypothetical protein